MQNCTHFVVVRVVVVVVVRIVVAVAVAFAVQYCLFQLTKQIKRVHDFFRTKFSLAFMVYPEPNKVCVFPSNPSF